MTCNIIRASHASINGSTSAYGGGIVSASYSPSTINGYNRASVTLAGATSTPGGGDSASIGIAGLNLNMKVGSVTESARAGSVSMTTINYYDNSQALDNEFVLLREEVAEGLGAIGDKYGPRPDVNIVNDLGLIVPASDTVFVKLRDFYAGAAAAGFNIDGIIANAPGKTVYKGSDFMDAFGGVLGAGFDIPGDAVMDFQGSLREVIGQMCNEFGMIAYWDPEKDEVVTAPITAPSKGSSSKDCTIIATSSTSDYTGSRAQGACGTFQTSNPGESQSSSGGNMSRYFPAKLLKPTLKLREGVCGGNLKEIALFDRNGAIDPDIAKAITASQDAKVFAMYVVQSVLSYYSDLPNVEIKKKLDGKDNAQDEIIGNISQWTQDFIGQGGGNKFLADYYKCAFEDGNVFLSAGCDGGNDDIEKALKNLAKEPDGWNGKPGEVPSSIGGPFHREFQNGSFIFVKKNLESSVFGKSLTLTGQGDLLRKFLNVISKFVNQVYVVKSDNPKRSATAGGKNYGYYITSNATVGGQSPQAESGFTFISMDPWAPISDCGNSYIQELVTVMLAIYGNPNTCTKNPFQDKAIIDFIYALEKDQLERFFGGGAAQAQAQNQQQAMAQGGQGHIMYLMVKEPGNSIEPEFTPERYLCFDPSKVSEVSTPSDAVVASEQIGAISIPAKSNLGLLNEEYDIGVITQQPQYILHDMLTEASIDSRAPRKIPLWFNVEGNSSSLDSGPGHAFLGAGSLPPAGAWKSSMNFGVSVNATDIAYNNGINQSYLADTYDEGFTYSRENIGLMSQLLINKINASTWIDNSVGSSTSTTYLLVDDKMPSIPSPADGLDSLSISSQGGQTELTVTVGNANFIRALGTLRDLKAKNSHLQHSHSLMLPSVLNSAPNTKLQNIANGIR